MVETSPVVVVAWVLVAVGWIVSNYQGNARESRKETKAEVDACCKTASDLLDKSRRFFSREGSEAACIPEAADIKFGLRRLMTRMDRLSKQRRTFSHIMGIASEMFEVISGDDFESVSRTAYSANSDRLLKVEETTHRLIDTLETAFAREFRTPRQRFVECKNKHVGRRTRDQWRAQRFRPGE